MTGPPAHRRTRRPRPSESTSSGRPTNLPTTEKKPTEATRKSTRNKQAALANALGNPAVDQNVDQKKLSRNRREKTPKKKKNKKKQPSSFSSFIHELGFKENSPEFIASIRFLE